MDVLPDAHPYGRTDRRMRSRSSYGGFARPKVRQDTEMGNNLSVPSVLYRMGHDRGNEHDVQLFRGTPEGHVTV